MICSLCSENQTKYKCPKCYIRYCSLPCYKSHKENCSEISTESIPVEKNSYEDQRVNYLHHNATNIEESEDFVPLETLQKLDESEDLRRILANPHLRKMVEHLNSSKQADKDLEAAMKEPIFTELVDQCLQIVQPNSKPE